MSPVSVSDTKHFVDWHKTHHCHCYCCPLCHYLIISREVLILTLPILIALDISWYIPRDGLMMRECLYTPGSARASGNLLVVGMYIPTWGSQHKQLPSSFWSGRWTLTRFILCRVKISHGVKQNTTGLCFSLFPRLRWFLCWERWFFISSRSDEVGIGNGYTPSSSGGCSTTELLLHWVPCALETMLSFVQMCAGASSHRGPHTKAPPSGALGHPSVLLGAPELPLDP